MKWKKIILCKIRFKPYEVRLNWISENLENLQIPVSVKGAFDGSIVQERDLQPKPNTTKFGSIFNLNMMLTILDVNHCQEL